MKTHTTARRFVQVLASAYLATMLASCGGGSAEEGLQSPASNTQASTTAVNPAPVATAAQTPAATAKPAPAATAKLASTVTVKLASSLPAKLKGVNLSGAENALGNPSARLYWDYIYPSTAEIDYYHNKGFTVIRLPVAGSRIQPVSNGALNATELGYIQNIISYCATKNMTVIIDPHDYGLKYDSTTLTMKILGVAGGLPASYFADFWSRLATAFASQPNVIFGLSNEPYMQTPAQWQAVAAPAIAAIRAAGATQMILIPGTGFSGAHSWVTSGNAAAWTGFSEPLNNFAFEVHQYLDSDNSGTHVTCVANKGATVLDSATTWARANGYKLYLGEVGWSQDPSCINEGPAIMNYTTANADVWAGWTYWGAGPWYPQTYIYMLDPASFTTPVDKPQMQALLNNLG